MPSRFTPCIVFVSLVVLIATAVAAQPGDRFATFGAPSTIFGPSKFHLLDASGRVVSTLVRLPSVRLTPLCTTMAENNRSIRVGGTVSPLPPAQGFILDIQPNGRLTTVYLGSGCLAPTALFADDDGDWIVVEPSMTVPNSTRFYRLQGSNLTTLATAPKYVRAATYDEETGLIVARCYTNLAPGSTRRSYCRIDPRTGSVTTLASHVLNTPEFASTRIYYDASTGGFIDVCQAGSPGTSSLCRILPGSVRTLQHTFSGYTADLARPGPRRTGTMCYALASNGVFGIHRLAPDGRSLGFGPIANGITHFGTPLLRVGSRHLRWSLDKAPNDRTLSVSFPGESGRSYVVGFSLSGVRPGLKLPDGRVVPLAIDALTLLCLRGGASGMIDGAVGRLDANGEAVIKVRLNALGAALRGVRVWATALILDRAAPSGVAGFAGPKLLTVT